MKTQPSKTANLKASEKMEDSKRAVKEVSKAEKELENQWMKQSLLNICT